MRGAASTLWVFRPKTVPPESGGKAGGTPMIRTAAPSGSELAGTAEAALDHQAH